MNNIKQLTVFLSLILFISCSKSPDPSKNAGTWKGSMVSVPYEFYLDIKVDESDHITGTFKNLAQYDYTVSGSIVDNKFNISIASHLNDIYGTASGFVYTNNEMKGTFYFDDKAPAKLYSGTFNVKKK